MPEGADSGSSVTTPDEIEEKLEEGEFYEITYLSGKEEGSVLGKVDTLRPHLEKTLKVSFLAKFCNFQSTSELGPSSLLGMFALPWTLC